MEILKYLWERRTTVLGYLVTVLGVLATSSKFSPSTVEWFVLIIGVITAILGHHNNAVNKKQAAKTLDAEQGFARIGMLAFVVAIAAMFLSSCGTMPVANSYSQRVAGAYATIAVVNDTAAILRNANTLSVEDAREVQSKTREAIGIVDAAALLTPIEGSTEVERALSILKQAQDLLCANRPTEPNCQYLVQRTQL